MSKANVTIWDVAKAAGVSKSTVSAALNEGSRIAPETRANVLDVVQKMGFSPNLHARRLQNKVIGDMIGLFSLDLDLSVGTRKIKVIRGLLSEQGFDVPIHSSGYYRAHHPHSVQKMMAALCRQRPRAIICNTTDLPSEAFDELQAYQDSGGSVICYDHPVEMACDTVIFDRADNSYQAARHLLELGHRKIGFFQVGRSKPSRYRLQGFERALGEYDLTVRAEWLFGSTGKAEFEDDGVLMAQQFLQLHERPSGVCIVNDFAAVAFVAEMHRAGLRVPQDVSVVGHDDRPIARYGRVPLTSVTHPVEDIAQQVVQTLLNRLQDQNAAPVRKVIRGELVVRESTAAPTIGV
jgi:LacI family transcriptional regulator